MHSSEPECQNPYVNNLEVNNGRYYCCPESITIKDSRSRYAEFIYRHCVKSSCHTVRRDREPSRIPVKRLTRVLQKSRKIRRLVKKHITKNVPRSSGIHITCRSLRRTVVYSHNTQQCRSAQKVKPRKRRVFTSHLATTARRKNRKTYNLKFELKGYCRFPKAVSKYVSTESHVYKNLNHRVKFCQSSLCVDIEKNPGPVSVVPSQTLRAPYCQGNVAVFGQNAGQQCTAMSLCSLIYNDKNSITSAEDLVEIMNIGNELYSSLSRISRNTFLMLTELPTMITVFDTNYHLQYSESYTCRLHANSNNYSIEGFPYTMPLDSALQTLIAETYNSFLLTIECNTVAIYHTLDGTFKVFDSHARDSFGVAHPQGTCVLLHVQEINKLVEYFQSLYTIDAIFELKGLNISISETETVHDHNKPLSSDDQNVTCQTVAVNEHMTMKTDANITLLKKSCAICFYCICFSIIKPCSYWKSVTLEAVVEHGDIFYKESFDISNQSTINELPCSLKIYDADIAVKYSAKHQGILSCDSLSTKLVLQRLILENKDMNTGFLLWISGYCVSCVICHTGFATAKTKKTKYFVMEFHESQGLQVFEHNHVDSLIETLCKIVTKKFNCHELEYCIQFLLCTSHLTNTQRQRIMKKHKSTSQKKLSANKRKNNYIQMEPAKKKVLLERQALYDRNVSCKKKKGSKSSGTNNQIKPRNERPKRDLNHFISIFHKKIMEGPYYTCSVCNRLLYRKSVTLIKEAKYSTRFLFTNKKSFDEKEYICKTCDLKVSKGKVPCQAVYNKLLVDEIPPELDSLEKLEQILIAQRIVFEKIVVMPKGQQRKIKGAICNVPVNCDQTCNILPRPPERSGIIMLKLKRKLQFRGHVYFQAVRPEFIVNALMWLRMNNPLYSNVVTSIENIDPSVTKFEDCDTHVSSSTCTDNEVCSSNQNSSKQDTMQPADDNEEEKDDPLNEYRAPINQTCLQSVIPDYPVTVELNSNNSSGNEVYNIAPGENKHPVSLMTDKQCEELAFPVLFPKGRFGYTVEREVKLSPVKYFNARLLHYSGRFATNPEYLFFAQFIREQKKISDSINIALTKVHGQSVTASHLRSNAQSLQNLICQDQAYLFLRQIPGTPPYWQKFMYEVVAMVKQLGIPSWFMTLSCADLRWPELFHIIARTKGMNLTNEQVEALSYNERCSMLNLNPVIVAKHFQYKVETFFTEVLLTSANPIGKIVYYALRIEFQMRGSPHLHALIWTSDCPKLSHENKQGYIEFIDKHVQAYIPNRETDPQLHELVQTYENHNHSKTCRKYKNIPCRFNFGQFFTKTTIVAEPLSDNLPEDVKSNALTRRMEILKLVKEKIDNALNPNKPDYDPKLTETDILSSLGISEEQYYWALSTSADSYYDLHLKQPIDSCFINNYFVAGIKGFEANVDLQPVFNHYKCITYVARTSQRMKLNVHKQS